MNAFDVVTVRNSGSILYYRDAHDDFRRRASEDNVRVFNELTGKADTAGKQYLLDLYAAGHPVIPTVDNRNDAMALASGSKYVAKPKFGADSVGLQYVQREDLENLICDNLLVQLRIHFEYEVSFYFVDHKLEYALYAPDPDQRWRLQQYEPTDADRTFAQTFIDWNDITHGIQRVDACRTRAGNLLLVELEDLNPYLSLDLVDAARRDTVVKDMADSIAALSARPAGKGA